MKKIRIILAFLICIYLLTSLMACKSTIKDENNSVNSETENLSSDDINFEKTELMHVFEVDAAKLIKPTDGDYDFTAKVVASSANDFAFKLGSILLKDIEDENFVFSPFAVWLPMAALVNATYGKNKQELLHALSAEGISETDVNNTASRVLYDLTKSRKVGGGIINSPLKIVNIIFVDIKETLNKDFVQVYMDYFRGSSVNVDFSSHQAIDEVNRWVCDSTDGWITDLVTGFQPATVAVIANAIYFSDDWDLQFDPEQTEEGVFHALGGEAKAMYMLRKDTVQLYYEDGKIQALPLIFGSGGGLYIMLPKSGNPADILSTMTDEYFKNIQENSIQATGTLKLPRFSVENEITGLKEALGKLGVPLFDENASVLTGVIEGTSHIHLSEAIQKTIIQVDENGTTAAASIYSGMPAGAYYIDPAKPFEMICDRPFVFILYDLTHDGGYQVLFTGIVNQP